MNSKLIISAGMLAVAGGLMFTSEPVFASTTVSSHGAPPPAATESGFQPFWWAEAYKAVAVGTVAGAVAGAVGGALTCGPVGALAGAQNGALAGAAGGFASYAISTARSTIEVQSAPTGLHRLD